MDAERMEGPKAKDEFSLALRKLEGSGKISIWCDLLCSVMLAFRGVTGSVCRKLMCWD